MVTKTNEWTPTNFAKSKESIANSHSIEFFNFNECVQVSKASLFTISPLGEHHYSPAKSFRLWVLRLRAQPQEPCGQRGAHSSDWRWPSGSSPSSWSCVTWWCFQCHRGSTTCTPSTGRSPCAAGPEFVLSVEQVVSLPPLYIGAGRW